MFEYIKGIVADILLDKIIVEVNGIGYRINSTMNSAAQARKGEALTIYTYLAVKEDEISLYGFVTKEELELFKHLISVSKIGPKVATGILSTYTPQRLVGFIGGNDFQAISKAPGVGKKTAERIVLELKDKVKHFSVEREENDILEPEASSNQEVIDALMALGYHRTEAEKALLAVGQENGKTEEIIKNALKWLVK
ncbi:Holliday junction branch migration protein RuvA [Alkaliphilus crotonatoxidans]